MEVDTGIYGLIDIPLEAVTIMKDKLEIHICSMLMRTMRLENGIYVERRDVGTCLIIEDDLNLLFAETATEVRHNLTLSCS